MESEEGKESRLAQSFPEQPRPSTSKEVLPPAQEGAAESRTTGNEELLLNSNHETADSEEAGREVWGHRG